MIELKLSPEYISKMCVIALYEEWALKANKLVFRYDEYLSRLTIAKEIQKNKTK